MATANQGALRGRKDAAARGADARRHRGPEGDCSRATPGALKRRSTAPQSVKVQRSVGRRRGRLGGRTSCPPDTSASGSTHLQVPMEPAFLCHFVLLAGVALCPLRLAACVFGGRCVRCRVCVFSMVRSRADPPLLSPVQGPVRKGTPGQSSAAPRISAKASSAAAMAWA